MVWNETLKREIPADWEVKKLNACLKHINTGLNPRDNFVLDNMLCLLIFAKTWI